VLPVRTDCLPVSAIPHNTRIYNDYLFNFNQVSKFYSRPPNFNWISDELSRIQYPNDRRSKVADILDRQNRTFGASEKTLANIDRLRRGAVAAVTGQQVGLFGGPVFSILKAVSVLELAEQTISAGQDCIPVFWLATEDHDLDEVNNAILPANSATLEKLQSTSRGKSASPVKEVKFGDEISALVKRAQEILGDGWVSDLLASSYYPGVDYGQAFGKLFAGLFSQHGIVLLDPSDPELHALAKPVMLHAAQQSRELDAALLERGRELRTAGYHEQVKVTPESTTLFLIENGARTPVHIANGGFMVGAQKISADDLFTRIDQHPEHFSANVLLRPVVQDYLLPTLAYFGGPAEVAYFAQISVVYEKLAGRVTPILPRFTATLIEPRVQKLLTRYNLTMMDFFGGAELLKETLASRELPQEVNQTFDSADTHLDEIFTGIKTSLQKLDPTLVDAAKLSERKMRYQIERLRSKAARAELRRNQLIDQHANELLTNLFPNQTLQEREIAGIYFIARHGTELIDELVDAARAHCPGHQLLYL
jgi:bacillithiol biosynthesis cysteine-adding enzyme BshC